MKERALRTMASKGTYAIKLSDIKKGIVTNRNVRLAIAKQAIIYWNMLPKHTQAWFTISDMIAEGINHVVVKVAKKYKKDLSAIITFVVHCVRNHYINLVKYYMAKERKETGTVSLETPVGDNMTLLDILQRDKLVESSFENCVIARIDAEVAFDKVYSAADFTTRKYIIRWLLQPKFSRNKMGDNFSDAVSQFKYLAYQHGLTYGLCRSILTDAVLRESLALKLIRSHRTPKRAMSRPILKESLEGDLVALVCR